MISIQHTKIKIIGSNCSNGIKLKKMVERATEEVDVPVDIELEEKNKSVKNIPALVINGNLISEGKVLTVREITKLIKSEASC